MWVPSASIALLSARLLSSLPQSGSRTYVPPDLAVLSEALSVCDDALSVVDVVDVGLGATDMPFCLLDMIFDHQCMGS